jgi:hypothetical protein
VTIRWVFLCIYWYFIHHMKMHVPDYKTANLSHRLNLALCHTLCLYFLSSLPITNYRCHQQFMQSVALIETISPACEVGTSLENLFLLSLCFIHLTSKNVPLVQDIFVSICY